MRTLLVMRHGKSSWAHPTLSDHDRPLKKRGRRDAPRMGEHIEREDQVPGLIVTSTAARARSTAELVATQWIETVEIRESPDLYGAGPDDVLELLAELDPDELRIMVVGHNPGLQMLVSQLSQGGGHLPTAAVAVIELPIDSWAEIGQGAEGRLANLWLPRELW